MGSLCSDSSGPWARMIINANHHRSTLLVIRNHIFDLGILKNVILYHKSSKKDLDKIPHLFLKSQSFLLSELAEHLIIKGKILLLVCMYNYIAKFAKTHCTT